MVLFGLVVVLGLVCDFRLWFGFVCLGGLLWFGCGDVSCVL